MAEPADIAYALEGLRARQSAYARYRNYVEGRHNLAFSTDIFRTAFGSLFRQLAYNRCGSVINALSDRLVVENWHTGNGQEATTAKDIWMRNRLDRRQGEVYQEAATAGDAYVIVWPDEETGKARIWPNKAHCTTVLYDDEYDDRIVLAVKAWRIDRGIDKGRWRVTVYEPDVITRYITSGKADGVPTKLGSLLPYEDDEQPETKNPYGVVPVFHFGNDSATGEFGSSELRDVIPLQDGLNKSLADMLVTGEYASFPQRGAVGIASQIADNGEEAFEFKPGSDRVWTSGNENARFGQFDATDMTQFVKTQDSWDAKIARVSRTPLHWLTGEIGESGEQLKTAEGPFVAKTHDRQHAWGPVWTEALALALRIDNAESEVDGLKPVWQPAESRSEREKWELAVQMAAANVPLALILEEVGWDEEKVKRATAMAAQADQAEREARAAETARMFGEEG